MQRKVPWWSITGMILVLVGVAAYNFWAYNCGYCAIRDMKIVGPQVRAVGFLIVGAVVCWVILYLRRGRQGSTNNCHCGRIFANDWAYCPDCGTRLS